MSATLASTYTAPEPTVRLRAFRSYNFRLRADLKPDVDARGLIRADINSFLRISLEAGFFDRKPVIPRRQVEDGVGTFRAGDRFRRELRIDVHDFYFGARNNRSGCISCCSDQRAG